MSDRPPLRYARVIYVGPLSLGLVYLVLGPLTYALLTIVGAERFEGVVLASVAAASFVGGIVHATLFSVVAMVMGGVRIGIDTSEPRRDTLKVCPKCGARVGLDRSFCPACDFSF